MSDDKRFHVVRVNRYPGDYSGQFMAYAVADREQANRVISQKFNNHEAAYRMAEGLNTAEATRKE